LNGRVAGIIEAKRLNVDPENVLSQAERYARGLTPTGFELDGIRVPLLWATNGKEIFFRDCRHPLNISRSVADYLTPERCCGAIADR
jgi:type I restriction enzyme, R subunit